jgi:hypothetical protein
MVASEGASILVVTFMGAAPSCRGGQAISHVAFAANVKRGAAKRVNSA